MMLRQKVGRIHNIKGFNENKLSVLWIVFILFWSFFIGSHITAIAGG